MLAFSVSVALFVFWLFLGLGILAALRFGKNAVRNALLAPTIGASAVLIPAFTLSRLGLPVRTFAGWLGLVLLATGCVLAFRYRPRIPWKGYRPFLLLFALGACLTTRPIFWYGFNWVSYANDDMTNYVLSGQRLFDHALQHTPTVTEYLSDRDPSLHYWFGHVYTGTRAGSEMLLAWLHGVVGLTTLELFMPLIVALYFTLLSAVGGLVYRTAGHRSKALWACLLLVCSALTSLGLLYQLIAQVWGLALLSCCVAMLMRPLERMDRSRLIKNAALAALAVSALVISYPEIVPFVVAPTGIFVLRTSRRKAWRGRLAAYGLVTVFSLLLINTYTRVAAGFLAIQLFKGVGGNQALLFPYFLVPSGLANFWGMLPIQIKGSDPWLSIAIAAGGILLLISLLAIVRQAIRFQPCALVAACMFLLGAQLAAAKNDFGLFKLTMFVQPFLIGTLVASWSRWAAVRRPLLVLVAAIGLFSQYMYVERSTGELGRGGSGLVEVPGASASGLVEHLLNESKRMGPKLMISDTVHTSLGKLESAAMFGSTIVFPADDIFGGVVGVIPKGAAEFFNTHGLALLDPRNAAYAEFLRDSRKASYDKEFFRSPNSPTAADMFYVPKREHSLPPGADVMLLANGRVEGVLNRNPRDQNDDSSVVVVRKLSEVRNHLIFVASTLGRPPAYDGDTTGMGLFPLEPDPTYRSTTVAGLGRYLLFEILNSSSAGHLALNVTSTYMADGVSQVPLARVQGDKDLPLKAVGRGSARLFSPVVVPQQLHGRPYILLDMGSAGSLFPERKKGLMNLFGGSIRVDTRRMVGFARDISFISPEDYAGLVPPTAVAGFPTGLANRALEYSGVYEDGWIAEDCYLRLRQPGGGVLRVVGMLPGFQSFSAGNRIRILEDGNALLDEDIKPGDFDFKFAPGEVPGPHLIRVQFKTTRQLSDEDPRPASARLTYVGFDSSLPTNSKDIADSAVAEVGAHNWYPLEQAGGLTFRWVNHDAELIVRPRPSGHAALVLDIEPGPSQKDAKLGLQVVDSTGATALSTTIVGRKWVALDLPVSSSGLTLYRLRADRPGQPVAGDGRTLNFRVFHVGKGRNPVPEGGGIELGNGWYGMETFGGESFRWTRNHAEVYVTARHPSTLVAEVEPLSGGRPARLDLFDSRGTRVFQTSIDRRSTLRIPLPGAKSAKVRFLFQMDERMLQRPAHDPRPLALRVFGLHLE